LKDAELNEKSPKKNERRMRKTNPSPFPQSCSGSH
jgi:hypothetical protein